VGELHCGGDLLGLWEMKEGRLGDQMKGEDNSLCCERCWRGNLDC